MELITKSLSFRKDTDMQNTKKTQLVKGWSDGGWKEAVDNRGMPKDDEVYDDYMKRVGYEHTQTMGNPNGYHAETWTKLSKNSHEADWIVILSDGNTTIDIMVTGYMNLADLMSHLGPGFTASCLDGEELSAIWAERAAFRDARDKAKSKMMDTIKKHQEPCDHPECIANHEREKAAQVSRYN